MCGVIGLSCEHEHKQMGGMAARLLRMLEYRGYDSTGGIVQNEKGETTLRKDVGAPSDVVIRLGIYKLSGLLFCGQVRWATFGAVTKENAQPHEMRCKLHFYGAHNGNITNCERLKEWLRREGHEVKSDNDGEMLVHTIEHFFARELQYKNADDRAVREAALRAAVLQAAKQVTGSFASIVVDPVSRIMVAIKAGSSLYIGRGHDPDGGDFTLASSDLASVLQMTRILVPIRENEFAVFGPGAEPVLYDLRSGRKLKRASQRSLLKVEETRLQPQFKYFMEQEIFHQVQTTRRLLTLFTGGNAMTRRVRERKDEAAVLEKLKIAVSRLAEVTDAVAFQEKARQLLDSAELAKLNRLVEADPPAEYDHQFDSSYGSLLEELRDIGGPGRRNLPLLLKMIDATFDLEDIDDVGRRIRAFLRLVTAAADKGGTIYILACGSSFHAAKTAPIFFNEICGLPVIPLLPGEFRAQCTRSLRPNDLIIGISQSGETKDLIDVFNLVEQQYPTVKKVCILNNTNSTLGQEKSDLCMPLFCGPEIAVPATKSFINQLMVLLILAVRLHEHRQGKKPAQARGKRATGKKAETEAVDWREMLERIPALIDRTLKTTSRETELVAQEIHQAPSMHILATRMLGIAKEGALKIREIVLNHTEGFEASEFKHGPNTILGINTVFGMGSVRSLLETFGKALYRIIDDPAGRALDNRAIHRMFDSVAAYAFEDKAPKLGSPVEERLFREVFAGHDFFGSMYGNYPLLFITGPADLDVNLTISQINTHKIRGADVFMIAEDDDRLREAVSIAPAGSDKYKHGYITLPRTGNPLMTIFSATVVLQMLAFHMSLHKMEMLNRLEIEGHGVHPDVPKNVSKSITVD
ncbi:MAG TPA: SIS domain-containing protein [Candidatus Ozemobacteraceae bacterium]|nr:SIS domain-containing protein [Candidatus Ozemobacteraceae bacterium]